MEFSGTKILVFGAGVSGVSAATTLAGLGAEVTLADGKIRQKLKNFSLAEPLPDKLYLAFGRQDESLLEDKQLMIISPGI